MQRKPTTIGAATAPVRVVIIEDHALLAQTLGVALRAEGCDVSVPLLRTVPELLEDVAAMRPRVVLLDLDLGDEIGDGAELVADLVARGASVLIVSGATDRLRIASAIECGAAGFVAKSSPFDHLVETVLALAAGKVVMDERSRTDLLRELARARRVEAQRLSPFASLTPKEREVLVALFHGATVETIAGEWVVSEATVRSHVRGVLTKLGVSSQLAAVVRARQEGWVA